MIIFASLTGEGSRLRLNARFPSADLTPTLLAIAKSHIGEKGKDKYGT